MINSEEKRNITRLSSHTYYSKKAKALIYEPQKLNKNNFEVNIPINSISNDYSECSIGTKN